MRWSELKFRVFSSKVKQMVRYDPSKDEHKIFEVKDSSDEETSHKTKETDKTDPDSEARNGQAEELVNEEKFYQVEANIKELFDSTANKDEANATGFQFKFDNVEEKKVDKFALEDYNDETKYKSKSMPKSLEERFKSKYSSSSESEESEAGEEEEEDGMDDEDDQDEPNFDDHPSYRKDTPIVDSSQQIKKSRPLPKPTGPLPKIDHFLPREDEKDIVEALKFFCRTAEVDDLREEWQKKRAVLVEECKKKHKRVLRKKSTFENKKILPWKNTSSKSHKKS